TGVQIGMTVAQARAILPGLIVMPPSSAAENAATAALADAAESLSPVVEMGTPGCVWIDLSGLGRIHRSHNYNGEAEAALENEIAEEAARRVYRIGMEAAVGVAAIKEVAYLAARCGGRRIIPAGREREFLDWMPLDLTELGADRAGEDLELRLKRLGIRRLGDLARLDIRAVGSRLGEAGVALARLARGEGSSTVRMRPRAEIFAEAIELEYGIENLEALGFILHAMLNRIGERLQLRGLVAGDMTLSLGLADRSRDDRRVAVAASTGEMRSLLMLLNLSLAASTPSAAIETIRLTLEPRHPRPAQNDMFIPAAPAPDRLEAAIARIAALCGPDRVGTLLPAESYRPEAVRLATFAPTPAQILLPRKSEGNSPSISIAQMAVRTMRPAEEIEVMCTRGIPEFVRGQNISARVVAIAGPWRRQGEWWAVAEDDSEKKSALTATGWQANAPAVYARDYYELALADGGIYRMYRDHYSQKWFVDGVYD
ncbi:MAG TPA: hypothetical protein VNU00_06600, partial [Candidatus Binataceae bacterium]|nr:hypothetical protein [Candidatus Binataceae bacterium]